MNEIPDHPFFKETPENFFSGGPFLDVALSADVREKVPTNASSLLREWESMLDPIDALREWSQRVALGGEWLMGKWFVVPSLSALIY